MFRISQKSINKVNDSLTIIDRHLSLSIEQLNDARSKLQKQGFENVDKHLNMVLEQLVKERRSVCKISGQLEQINLLYKKADEKVVDLVENVGQQKSRTASWSEISFSEEGMKYINKIRL